MKIKVPAKSHKKTLFLIVLPIVIIVFLIIWLIFYRQMPDSPKTKQEAQKSAISQKDDFVDASSKDTDSSASNSKPAEIPTSSDTISLLVSQDNSTVVLVVKLDGQGYSSGKCTVNISGNTKTFTRSVDIIYQPEHSTCAGFSIPSSSIGPGLWTINLTVDPLGGGSLKKTTTLEVT